ncbi:hypothetical protein GGR54DRAFT_180178 [Hypoxylon sp. NC1633]|nr:hypothetical protein GGR54DRAFT_180178 [Hypoxylon sp. NC1633]
MRYGFLLYSSTLSYILVCGCFLLFSVGVRGHGRRLRTVVSTAFSFFFFHRSFLPPPPPPSSLAAPHGIGGLRVVSVVACIPKHNFGTRGGGGWSWLEAIASLAEGLG